MLRSRGVPLAHPCMQMSSVRLMARRRVTRAQIQGRGLTFERHYVYFNAY